MKDRLITEIQAKMAAMLNLAQNEELCRVLAHCFHSVEITERKPFCRQENDKDRGLLDVFLSAKRVEGCSQMTLKYYDATMRQLFERVKKSIREICTDDLRFYLADYQKRRNASKVTIDNMRRIFSSFFGWLEDEEYILKSPVRRIRKIKTEKIVKEAFSDEDIEVLRDSCKELRDLAMIDLLVSTGMRVGELVRLNRADMNFHERECVVFGKGSRERTVYFDARTKIHLLNYLDSRSDSNPSLFVSLAMPHERLLIGGVEARLHEIGRRVEIHKIHPHKFRRTLATQAIDKGLIVSPLCGEQFRYALYGGAVSRNSAHTV